MSGILHPERPELPFLTEESFENAIELTVRTNKISYIEAIVDYCDENLIDYSQIKRVMTKNLIDKLNLAAQEEGYFPIESSLPI